MAIELVSFDDLKILLELDNNEVDYPDVTQVQESVVSVFEEHTGRTLTEDNYQESLFIFGKSKMIPLKSIPVSAVTSVTVDGNEVTDFSIRPYGVELGSKVEASIVDVSYRGGITSVPKGLKRAALLQTVYEYQNKDHIGAETVSTDGGLVTTPALGLLKTVRDILSSYKHPIHRLF